MDAKKKAKLTRLLRTGDYSRVGLTDALGVTLDELNAELFHRALNGTAYKLGDCGTSWHKTAPGGCVFAGIRSVRR